MVRMRSQFTELFKDEDEVMSNGVVDQAADSNGWFLHQVLHAKAADGTSLFVEPSFVKSAAREDLIGQQDMRPGLYADPVHHKFACHTGAATWLSAVAFHTQKQAYAEGPRNQISTRLDTAAKFHGIEKDIEAVKKAAERYLTPAPEDLTDLDYGIVIEGPDKVKERHFPIRNGDEIKVAWAYSQQHRNALGYDSRRVMAEKILRKAASLGVVLDDLAQIEKQAGHGTCSSKTAAEFIFSRVKVLHAIRQGPEEQKSLTKIAMQILDNPGFAHLPTNLHKIASLVEKVDVQFRLNRMADLPTAEDTLFGINIKTASAIERDSVAVASGNIYSKKAMHSLSPSAVKSMMGEDFVRAVSPDGLFLDLEKLAALAPTLPRPDAALFDLLMKQSGISPVYRERSQYRGGLDQASLTELAALHAQDRSA